MLHGDRLRLLRKEKGQLQKDVARHLGISERGYQHYELGERKPDIPTLEALADYFNVSTDYLLGRTDKREVGR